MRADTKVRQRAVRVVWALLFVVALSTTLFGQANQALIVHDGAGISLSAAGDLATKLAAGTAAYTVTQNSGVPAGSLAAYKQVWDVRYNTALSGGDVTAYTTYLSGGGALFLLGENTGFMTRNNSITSFVATMGGGTVTAGVTTDSQTVLAPFTGPNAITTVSYMAAAGIPAPQGTGSAITQDSSNRAASIVWAPGTLSAATTGTLIVMLDVNPLLPGAGADLQNLVRNLIEYLAAPTPITPAATPVPPSLLLVLAGGAAAAAMEIRRRMIG